MSLRHWPLTWCLPGSEFSVAGRGARPAHPFSLMGDLCNMRLLPTRRVPRLTEAALFLRGQRVAYWGRNGDQHTEWFPGAKPANTWPGARARDAYVDGRAAARRSADMARYGRAAPEVSWSTLPKAQSGFLAPFDLFLPRRADFLPYRRRPKELPVERRLS